MEIIHSLHPIDTHVGELGVTVRRGPKWRDKLGYGIPVGLCSCSADGSVHTEVGSGTVQVIWWGRFKDILARHIELEHEVGSRTYSGLLASMQRAYGPQFDENEFVTVIVYRRDK